MVRQRQTRLERVARLRFDVDWVLVISAMYLHGDVLTLMKRAGLKVAGWPALKRGRHATGAPSCR
jgi:hypothetical protein